jgi:hypothetical protein
MMVLTLKSGNIGPLGQVGLRQRRPAEFGLSLIKKRGIWIRKIFSASRKAIGHPQNQIGPCQK